MWSDQYDLNIQSSGLTNTYDTCVIRGSSLDDGICWFYLQDKKIKAVCGVSVGPKIGRDIRIGGMLSAKAVEVDPRVLEDTGIKLQTLMQ